MIKVTFAIFVMFAIFVIISMFEEREALKKDSFLGIIPKPADPPTPFGTFRNKNLNFAQI